MKDNIKPVKISTAKEVKPGMIQRITDLDHFKDYEIRALVEDAKELGSELANAGLKTNQIRKFLDAINRIKANLIEVRKSKSFVDEEAAREYYFEQIKIDIVMLQPKLAYAADRQSGVKPLQDVLDLAIFRVRCISSFERLVQFVESIVAYHKAAGGKLS
jgi:CRISPR-associated protein Csm2